MLYALHEAAYYASSPMRQAALLARDFWSSPVNPGSDTTIGRNIYASADLLANVTRRYGKPEWNINSVAIDGFDVRVRAVEAWSSPWVKLSPRCQTWSRVSSGASGTLGKARVTGGPKGPAIGQK